MAPERKGDPGPRFDWRRLARAGLSVWPEAGGAAATSRRTARAFGYPDVGGATCCSRRSACGSGPGRRGRWTTPTGRSPQALARLGRVDRARHDPLGEPCADGRMAAGLRGRGKSGLHEAAVPGNARPGQPEGKRHREQTACVRAGARVKRWGKSPPRDGQPDRHGKPHREQCRIGASRRLIPSGISRQGRFSPRGPGWQLEPVGDERAQRNGHPFPARGGQNPAYRPSAHDLPATLPPQIC